MTATQGRPQAREASETREVILRIAIEAIEHEGESALRVSNVAAAAGTSVGTLYHHFGDREGLVEAARAMQFRRHVDGDILAIQDAIEHATSLDDFNHALERLAGMTEGPERREASWAKIDVLGCARRRPRLAAALAQEQQRLSSALAEVCVVAQRKGFIDPAIEPRAMAVFVQAYAMGRVVGFLPGMEPLSEAAWTQMVVRMIRGLAPGADVRSKL